MEQVVFWLGWYNYRNLRSSFILMIILCVNTYYIVILMVLFQSLLKSTWLLLACHKQLFLYMGWTIIICRSAVISLQNNCFKAGIVLPSTSANNRTLVTRAVNLLLWICDALLLTPSISKIHTIKLGTAQSQHATWNKWKHVHQKTKYLYPLLI